jgi:uncharacterized SAM-binding protein YcdF (DUF218 family)
VTDGAPSSTTPLPAPPALRRRGCRAALCVLALLLLLALLAWRPVLRAIPPRLVEASPPRACDAIVVLAGDEKGRRVKRAVELFLAGRCPDGPLVVSGGMIYTDTTWAQLMADQAEHLGVPRARIVQQGRSRTTREDAQETLALLPGKRTILLVTSPWHSGRAAAEFRAAAPPGVEIVSCPSEVEGPDDWWTDPVATRALVMELLKRVWPG